MSDGRTHPNPREAEVLKLYYLGAVANNSWSQNLGQILCGHLVVKTLDYALEMKDKVGQGVSVGGRQVSNGLNVVVLTMVFSCIGMIYNYRG